MGEETTPVLLSVEKKGFSGFSNANHNPISHQDIWATEADILKINMGPFHLRDVPVRQQILIQIMPLRVTGGV